MITGARELQLLSHVCVRWLSDSLQYLSRGVMLAANINLERGMFSRQGSNCQHSSLNMKVIYSKVKGKVLATTCLKSQKGKGKADRYRYEQAQRMDTGIALPFRDLGARRGYVVSITPWPLYPRERPGTFCTGGWVGPRAGLDVSEKTRPHWDSIPGPSSL
jgi:hypothetical protein